MPNYEFHPNASTTPDIVYQSTGITKNLLKKDFKINPKQGSFGCLVPTLVLTPIKADFTSKKQSCK